MLLAILKYFKPSNKVQKHSQANHALEEKKSVILEDIDRSEERNKIDECNEKSA